MRTFVAALAVAVLVSACSGDDDVTAARSPSDEDAAATSSVTDETTAAPSPASPLPTPSPASPASAADAPEPLRVVPVDDAEALADALADAQPGDLIKLAAGTYEGRFAITPSGTADAPITLAGSRDAVIDGEGIRKGRTIELSASYWRLQGFTITNGQKGLMALGAQHTIVDGLLVHTIGDEAIHFRDGSSDNVIRNNEVHDTGLRRPGFGEAIYIGQAESNWEGGPDLSDRNQVVGNRLGPNIAAEHVDIKEGTTGGVVRGNEFIGDGQTGENSGESWVNAKGNDWLIAENTGAGAFASGFKTRVVVDGWGCGNVFQANTGSVAPYERDEGWAFDIHSANGGCEGHENVVCDDNDVAGGGEGVSNIATSSCEPLDGDEGD